MKFSLFLLLLFRPFDGKVFLRNVMNDLTKDSYLHILEKVLLQVATF